MEGAVALACHKTHSLDVNMERVVGKAVEPDVGGQFGNIHMVRREAVRLGHVKPVIGHLSMAYDE